MSAIVHLCAGGLLRECNNRARFQLPLLEPGLTNMVWYCKTHLNEIVRRRGRRIQVVSTSNSCAFQIFEPYDDVPHKCFGVPLYVVYSCGVRCCQLHFDQCHPPHRCEEYIGDFITSGGRRPCPLTPRHVLKDCISHFAIVCDEHYQKYLERKTLVRQELARTAAGAEEEKKD